MKSNPTFQHRHYAEIAKVLATIELDDTPAKIRLRFAEMFDRDNAKFDRARFFAAARGTPFNARDRR